MKKIIISKCVAIGLAALAFLSCDDAELKSIENGVYIQEAAPGDRYNQQVGMLTIDKETIHNITIRLSNYIDQDVVVGLAIDHDFLDSYNATNGTKYEVLPQKYLSFEESVTIVAGQVSAPLVNINIKTFETSNGESYAIPIKIASVDGGSLEAVGNTSRIIYLLSAPHRQKTPIFNRNNQSEMFFKSAIPTPTWTMEYWFRMNTTAWGPADMYVFENNAAPISFNSGTVSHMFIRFWTIGALQQGPCYQFQMQNPGNYFDDSTEAWEADTWYHIAYTYDGKDVKLYIDGEFNASKIDSRDYAWSGINICAFTMPVTQFAQIRIWGTCLQQASIKDAMNRQVPVTSENLVGYWKCDESEGQVLKDSSPNENHFTIKNAFGWSDEYNFSKPNVKK